MKEIIRNRTTETALREIAIYTPTVDWYTRLDVHEIFENRAYRNITELLLKNDTEAERIMRLSGADEKYVTGDSSDYDKFLAFAKIYPLISQTQIHRKAEMFLREFFSLTLPLSEKTAEFIWKYTSRHLESNPLKVKDIIKKTNTALVAVKASPTEELTPFEKLAGDSETAVVPIFDASVILALENQNYSDTLGKISEIAGVNITSSSELKTAVRILLDRFDSLGCRSVDIGSAVFDTLVPNEYKADSALSASLSSRAKRLTATEISDYKAEFTAFFADECARRGYVLIYRPTHSDENLQKLLRSRYTVPKTIALCSFTDVSAEENYNFKTAPAFPEKFSLRKLCEYFTSYSEKNFLPSYVGPCSNASAVSGLGTVRTVSLSLADVLGNQVFSHKSPLTEEDAADILKKIINHNAESFFGYQINRKFQI